MPAPSLSAIHRPLAVGYTGGLQQHSPHTRPCLLHANVMLSDASQAVCTMRHLRPPLAAASIGGASSQPCSRRHGKRVREGVRGAPTHFVRRTLCAADIPSGPGTVTTKFRVTQRGHANLPTRLPPVNGNVRRVGEVNTCLAG
jgi:hypothetical protein